MELASLLAPLAAALLLAVVVTAVHRLLPPALAARVVTCTLGVVLAAAVPTLWLLSLGFVAHAPLLGGRFEWCAKVVGVHEPVPTWAGVAGIVLSAVGGWRAVRAFASYRHLRRDVDAPHDRVEVADHGRPFAVTLPGRAGHVVLSTALLDLLDGDERAVVVAHERAHGRYRHDRYLLTSQLAVAVVPVVRPLARRLRFTLERWADEAAAAACGDRRLVARTLAKVALHDAAAVPALQFAGLGVAGRVEALLAPPASRPRAGVILALWAGVAATAVLSGYQLHHLGRVVAALCPG